VPYGLPYVVLCLVQAVAVLVPRPSPPLPWLGRRRLLGLIPLAAIGGVVALIDADPSLAQSATDLAVFATPVAFAGGALAFRFRPAAIAVVPLFWLAWKGSGRPQDIAIDALIVGAAGTLAWLTGTVAPRLVLAAAIIVVTVVDVYQVLVAGSVQPVANALVSAAPPSDLPHLQQAVWNGATMGWGDIYLAALLGTVIAAAPLRRRLEVAAVVVVSGLANGFQFLVLDLIPATVPVAAALVYALLRERGRIGTVPASEGGHADGYDGNPPR
jgi:hypothetical protein